MYLPIYMYKVRNTYSCILCIYIRSLEVGAVALVEGRRCILVAIRSMYIHMYMYMYTERHFS